MKHSPLVLPPCWFHISVIRHASGHMQRNLTKANIRLRKVPEFI